jgi:general secretion pathway protein K
LKDERGFALIITLIITALLVALCVEFADEVFVDTSARANFVAAQQASLLAESGVNGGFKLLQVTLARQSYSSLLDPWAKPLVIDDENGHLSVIIEDESSKLNLNQIFGPTGIPVFPVNNEIATRLLKNLGLSPDLLDGLNDWVDDSSVPPHPAGAKSPYYNTLKPPYNAKNGALDTVEELALVKGFNGALVQQLRPYITIYSEAPGKININTAPKEIIAALDDKMTSLTKEVLDYRKTTPFQQPGELAKVPGMETIAQGLSLSTTTKGTVYRIVSRATVGETTRIIEAVVRIDGTYVYWREY